MKFLTKINRNYVVLLMIILTGLSITGYFVLHLIVQNENKENLLEKEYLVKKHILNKQEIPNLYPVIVVKQIDTITKKNKPVIKEVLLKDEFEGGTESFLEYSNQIEVDGSYFDIKIRQSTFDSKDMIIILAVSLFILLLLALGFNYFITKKLNKTIWADFENNLREIENFSLSENNNLILCKTDIEEFDRLNMVLDNLTGKLKSDYLSLKEFTENASHEIQTPLSIVLLNLEEVLQQDITAETFQKVVSSINAIKRLSTLNQSLVLLTKIGNHQFKADKTLVINDIIEDKLQEFSTLFETKNLIVEFKNEKNFIIKMNEQLADLLINNLLSNAVNHNFLNGSIRISISEKEFKICNTGVSNMLTDENIFNRFEKGNSKSYGLGLAIVKNICSTHNLEIHYCKTDLHCFTINPNF
jgi:two-component system, OmpR family, sensor kinase